MFRIITFLIWGILIALGLVWLMENDGLVIINWLGYQITMRSSVALLLIIFDLILIFLFAYFLAKIFSFKWCLPNFLKHNPLKEKDQIIAKSQNVIDLVKKYFIAVDDRNLKLAQKLKKEIDLKIDNLKKLFTSIKK